MRRAHLLLVITALVLALAIVAPPAPKTAATATTAAPAATPAPRTDTRTVVGQIVSIDAAKGTMTVGESLQASRPKTSKLKESVTLAIDAKTQVFRGKRAATKEELRTHDHVVVRYVVTPQGARAVSCRASDAVAKIPPPTAAAGNSATTTASGTGTVSTN
jgi:hypothetical protein